MKFNKGAVVILKFDDEPRNLAILDKDAFVVSQHTYTSPYWITVRCEDEYYEVRGKDCRYTHEAIDWGTGE